MNAIIKAPHIVRAREYGRKDGGSGPDRLLEVLDGLKTQLAENTQKTKEFGDNLHKEIEKTGTAVSETKGKVDEVLAKSGELDGRIKEVEQKLAQRFNQAPEIPKSWGQSFIDSEQGKGLMASKSGRAKVEVKTVTSATGSAGDLIQPQRQPGIVTPPQRAMTIRNLLLPGTTGSDAIEYVKETGFTNNAAPVTEGAQKPESNITFTKATVNVKTIAHWIQASRQVLADALQLRSHIDGRMLFGLQFKEELQFLAGDGTGENILGLKPQATNFLPPLTLTGATRIDLLRLAILQVRLAEFPANAFILHPTDWAAIELQKDANGAYIFANPQGVAGPVMWGLPVVDTMAQTEGEFTTGAFNMAAQIFDRDTATIEVSTEDRDNFVKNMVTILAEQRTTLAVYRPEAIVDGAFATFL